MSLIHHIEQGSGRIQDAIAADSIQISFILQDAFAEYFDQYTSQAYEATVITPQQVLGRMMEGNLWVAVVDGKLVGTLGAMPTSEGLYLRGMGILKEVRGLNIGWQLLNRAQNCAIANNIHRLYLITPFFLLPAISLYENFGFKKLEGSTVDYYGTPLFMMEKLL